MAFDLFRAKGTVEMDDSDVAAGLKKTEGQFKETMGRIDRMRATAQLRAEGRQVDKEYARVRKLLDKWEHERAEAVFDADVDKADRAIAKLEAKLAALDQQRVDIKVGIDRQTGFTDKFLQALVGKLRATRREAEGTVNPIKRLGDALHNARLTLGPLSLSLRGMIVALGALAPIVYSLIGALAGLVSVLGQSLLGALGFAGSAAVGFGALLGGMIGVVVSHRKELKGLGNQVKELGQAWHDNTELPRSFGRAISEGLGTARKLIPLFGRESTRALDEVSQSGVRFARRMGGPEMRTVFQQLLSNSRRAIGPLTDALGNLAEAAARVSASFSRHFPDAARSLRSWTSNALDAVSDTGSLNRVIDELMASVRSVGSVFTAAGRFVVNFFMAGGRAGRRMLHDITDLINKWADWAGSARGRNEINDFLNDSWETTKKVASVLGSLAKLFSRLAPAMKPWVDSLLDGLKFITDLVTAFVDATGGADGLVRALAGLFILSRAVGWAVALGGALSRAAQAYMTGGLGGILTGGGRGGGGVVGGAGGGKGGGAARGGVFTPAGGSSSTASAAGRAQGTAFMSGVAKGLARGKVLLKAGGLSAVASILLFPDETSPSDIPTGLERRAETQARAYRKAFEKELMLPSGSLAGQFPAPSSPKQAAAFQQQVRGFQALAKTISGRQIIMRIAMEGDDEVQSFLSRLARTELGRKVLQIMQRGGPQAFSILSRLANTKLGQKILNILQRGGPQAQRIVDRLGNTKLREKILSIMERGGPNVERQLARIIGIRIPRKTQDIQERGSKGVIGAIQRIIAKAIPDKSFDINAHDHASGVLGGILGLIASVPSAVHSYIYTHYVSTGSRPGMRRNARGGGPGNMSGDMATRSQAMRAMASAAMGAGGGKVTTARVSPSGIVGEEPGFPEFVIPTNPSYRGRALRILADAMRAITPAHKRGLNHPRSYFRGKHKLSRLKKVAQSGNFFSQYVFPVSVQAEHAEREEHALDIMDTRYNTDAQLKDTVDDEGNLIQGNVDWHETQLAALEKKSNVVQHMYLKLSNMITKAEARIRFVRGLLQKWSPKSKELRATKQQRIADANEALGSLPDGQDALFTADDYGEREHAYNVERQMNKATQGTADTGGGGGGGDAGSTGVDSDTQAQLDQALARNTVLSESTRLANAALNALTGASSLGYFFGPGGAGSGGAVSSMLGSAAGGGGASAKLGGGGAAGQTIVNINALYPNDPATYAAIGQTAAQAFGQQGYVSSPRVITGV